MYLSRRLDDSDGPQPAPFPFLSGPYCLSFLLSVSRFLFIIVIYCLTLTLVAVMMARLRLFLSFSLPLLLFFCSISATSASTSWPVITTINSKSPSSTFIEYEEATATSRFYAATTSTVLEFQGSASTKSVLVEPSSTQVYQEVAGTTDYLYLAPSSTLSNLASAGSIIEVDSLPTATRIYYASASFDAQADVQTHFNTSTAYNIDATSLDVFCWYPISVCCDSLQSMFDRLRPILTTNRAAMASGLVFYSIVPLYSLFLRNITSGS